MTAQSPGKLLQDEAGAIHDQLQQAVRKVLIWSERAKVARAEGRFADAERCDAKVRDWQVRLNNLTRPAQE